MEITEITYHTLLLITFAPISVLNGPSSCKYEDPVGSAEFQACLRLGDRFLKRYTKALKRGRNGHCSHFSDFYQCVTNMMLQCPSLHRAMPADWLLVYEEFSCHCEKSSHLSEGCNEMFQCYEEQYSSILSRRCDAFYRFNIKQGTQEKCHFMLENVLCKEALVTSACGERAGHFTFNIAYMTLKGHDRCDIQPQKHYHGFHYDKDCPIDLVDKMSECENKKLGELRLAFYEENDLIAMGDTRDVKLSCRDYLSYDKCMEPLREKCPTGTRLVYEVDNKLRTYLLKMAYICVRDKDSYAEHISCYQEILHNKTLIKCNHIYQSLLPLLNHMTAFEFYCLPDTRHTITVLEQLSLLNECYESVFTKGCGARGSESVKGLMGEAFKDPYYLRYKYRPDCSVHGLTTTQTSTVSIKPLTSTAKPLPKSLDERSDDARAFSDARSTNGKQPVQTRVAISYKPASASTKLDTSIPLIVYLSVVLLLRAR